MKTFRVSLVKSFSVINEAENEKKRRKNCPSFLQATFQTSLKKKIGRNINFR